MCSPNGVPHPSQYEVAKSRAVCAAAKDRADDSFWTPVPVLTLVNLSLARRVS